MNSKNIYLLDSKMIKGGWVAPPNKQYSGKDFLNDEVFKDVSESGVNLLFCVIDIKKDYLGFVKFLDLCDKHRLYCIVPEEELKKDSFNLNAFKERIELYKKHKSVYGINLCDEPGYNKIEILSKNIEVIKGYVGDLKIYVNNMPMYALDAQIYGSLSPLAISSKTISIERYKDFIEKFYDSCDVDIVSYDFYPFRHEKGICDPRYFIELCMLKDIAVKHNKPLWNFTQVTSWSSGNVRNMSYSEIEWINNTSLACGVTGVQYFCYWTPVSKVENFSPAMIDKDGYKTKWYYFVKKANENLDRLFKYIKDADFMGTIAFGDTIVDFPLEKNLYSYGNLKNVYSEGTLVGCYKLNGKNMYLVVNTSVLEARTVELAFDKNINYMVVNGDSTINYSGDQAVLVIEEGKSLLLIEKD